MSLPPRASPDPHNSYVVCVLDFQVINHAATESDEFDDDDIKQIADYLATSAVDTLPIALLLRILDAAAQIDDSSTGFEKFVRCMGAYGLA